MRSREYASAVLAAIAIAAMPLLVQAVEPSPSVPPGVRSYAENTYEAVVEINVFEGDFTGDGKPDAIAFTYYAFVGGNARGLDVSLFENRGGKLMHRRKVEGVYGWEPRMVTIQPGQIEVTTTTLKPGEPRCCPTGETRHTIEP